MHKCRIRMLSLCELFFFLNANITLALFIYNSCTNDQSYSVSHLWLVGWSVAPCLAPAGDLSRNAPSSTSASGLSGATEHVRPCCFFLFPPLLPHESNLSVSDKGVLSPKWVGCLWGGKTTLASFSSVWDLQYILHTLWRCLPSRTRRTKGFVFVSLWVIVP